MLSAANVSKINNQIADEIRQVERRFNSDEEKLAALDRIAKLKALLSEQPPQTIDYDQLANALIEKLTPAPRHDPHPLMTLIETLARR
jgi:hypothetical protein